MKHYKIMIIVLNTGWPCIQSKGKLIFLKNILCYSIFIISLFTEKTMQEEETIFCFWISMKLERH